MRRAKALGGGRCEVFDEIMHSKAVNQLRLEAELQEALQKNQFRLYYQPVVQLTNGQIMGFEALLRWQHPEQGLISPYKFMTAAENSGLIAAAGRWVMIEACRQLRSWMNKSVSMTPIHVSVNISADQLADAAFVMELQNTLRESGIDPLQLRLEMTEVVAATDPKLTATILSNLKQLRVGVILDDFGTANSSLLALRQFPVEAVKIDRSLVGGMLLDRATADIVELIVLIAHKSKLKIIAKGIENTRQLDHLRSLGCELGQGFFFSQPVDAEQAQQLLRQRTIAAPFKAARAAD